MANANAKGFLFHSRKAPNCISFLYKSTNVDCGFSGVLAERWETADDWLQTRKKGGWEAGEEEEEEVGVWGWG